MDMDMGVDIPTLIVGSIILVLRLRGGIRLVPLDNQSPAREMDTETIGYPGTDDLTPPPTRTRTL